MNKIDIQLMVNGHNYFLRVNPSKSLLELLRDDLGFTGVKDGCREGECGACTVLVDGNPINSCLMLAGQATGCEITTIEGLATGDELHPVQKAFINSGAIQCGFCSPGFIMSSVALLEKNPTPTDLEIKKALSGNICRCTGYAKILDAVHSVVEEMKNNV